MQAPPAAVEALDIPSHRRVVKVTDFGDPSVLTLVREAMPAVTPGEVLVRVAAVGVNFADTMFRRGEYRRNQAAPCIPGFEAAGTVIAGGRLAPGTPVAVFTELGGAYTDYVLVPDVLVFTIPVDVSPELVASSFVQGTTAWYALHRYGRLRDGDHVLVSGASGGLGGWAIQLASESGAVVTGLASSVPGRLHARRLGCEEVLDSRSDDLATQLRARNPAGFDVIIDGVGGRLFRPMLSVLARGGRFVVVGSASQEAAPLDARSLMPRGQTVSGFVVRNVLDEDPGEPERALLEILTRASDGRVKVPYEVLPMSAASVVHERLEARSNIGKLVLDPTK